LSAAEVSTGGFWGQRRNRTLALIAITPLTIATLLVFVILPDAFFVDHKTANVKPAPAGAKH